MEKKLAMKTKMGKDSQTAYTEDISFHEHQKKQALSQQSLDRFKFNAQES
jgi:hypothetical protein